MCFKPCKLTAASIYLFENDFVHELMALDSLFLGDSDELLLQRDGPVTVVEVKEAGLGVHPEESGDVLVVWECSRKTNQSNVLLSCLHLTNGPGNQGLQHWNTK